MTSTTIIGGGITGLSAAFAAMRLGEEVTLFEPQQFGGVIKTHVQHGYTLELGPNVLVDKGELGALLADLDLQNQIIYPRVARYRQLVWTSSGIYEVPKSFTAFCRTPLLTLGDKLKLPFRFLRPGLLRPRNGDESVREFFSKLLSRRALESIVDPVLKGIYGGDIERLSARSLFPGLWASASQGDSLREYLRQRRAQRRCAGAPKIFVLRHGMTSLVNALQARLEKTVQLVREPVQELRREGGEFIVQSFSQTVSSEQVVIATSGGHTGRYLKTLLPQLAVRFNDIEYASLAVVHAAIDREKLYTNPLFRDAFGILFPAGLEDGVLGVMFNSELFPHVAPPGKHLLTICLGGREHPELADVSLEKLRERSQVILEKFLGIKNAEMLSAHVWPKAIPQYDVGHFRHIEAMKVAEQQLSGLLFLGVDHGGVGVPDRVTVGLRR